MCSDTRRLRFFRLCRIAKYYSPEAILGKILILKGRCSRELVEALATCLDPGKISLPFADFSLQPLRNKNQGNGQRPTCEYKPGVREKPGAGCSNK